MHSDVRMVVAVRALFRLFIRPVNGIVVPLSVGPPLRISSATFKIFTQSDASMSFPGNGKRTAKAVRQNPFQIQSESVLKKSIVIATIYDILPSLICFLYAANNTPDLP